MKTRKQSDAPRDSLTESPPSHATAVPEVSMVRTQIYLTRAEHEFLQSEGARRNEPMSAVIRRIIDEKMVLPDEAWTRNSLLEPTPYDPEYEGHEDSSLNHEHYAYGAPKKYGKRGGTWVLLPVKNE